MKFRAAIAAVATVPLALGLAACGNDQPEATGYKPSAPASTPVATTTAAPAEAGPGRPPEPGHLRPGDERRDHQAEVLAHLRQDDRRTARQC